MNTQPSRLRVSNRAMIALALLLSVLLPAAATAAPTVSVLNGCTPGTAYDQNCDVDHDGDVDVIDIQLAAGHLERYLQPQRQQPHPPGADLDRGR